MKNILSITCLCLIALIAKPQGNVADSTLRMSLFQFQAAFYTPGGDMGDLYGNNAAIGFSYAYKTGKNVLLGADFTYLFGNDVKNPQNVMREIRNETGSIIGLDGQRVNFLIQERGFTGGFYLGKIFPVFGPNPNSGIMIRIGLGYFEHRTWIEARNDIIDPIEGEYRKGYDRKRAGLALNEFIGYQYFSNNRYANFFAGFDIYQGFTTDYRTYNFDDMDYTNGDYLDILVGFRVGWVIPVYKVVADKFYID